MSPCVPALLLSFVHLPSDSSYALPCPHPRSRSYHGSPVYVHRCESLSNSEIPQIQTARILSICLQECQPSCDPQCLQMYLEVNAAVPGLSSLTRSDNRVFPCSGSPSAPQSSSSSLCPCGHGSPVYPCEYSLLLTSDQFMMSSISLMISSIPAMSASL